MREIASQITSLDIVYSTVYLGADQSKHQSSASLAFVWGIHRGPVNSPHKWPVTRKMLPFDDVIMSMSYYLLVIYTLKLPVFMICWARHKKYLNTLSHAWLDCLTVSHLGAAMCLLATLWTNSYRWIDFHEISRICRLWHKEQPGKLWWWCIEPLENRVYLSIFWVRCFISFYFQH